MSFSQKVVKLFSSAWLASSLFISLAIVTLIGSCFPQEPLVGQQALIERYASNYELFHWLGFTDVFHSWWYLFLFFLLSINLTVASFKRVFPGSRKATQWPQFLNSVPSNFPSQFKAHIAIERWNELSTKLRKTGWEVRAQNHSLIALKGAFHRFGPSLTHVGILAILLGAFISLLFGFNGVVQGVPGEQFVISNKEDGPRSYILVQTSKIFHSPIWLGTSPEFEVELGKTTRDDYANGQPKQWTTDLLFHSFNEQEKNKTTQKTVSVNNPVSFHGVDFYQADWKRVLQIIFNGQKFEINLDKIKGSEVAFISVSPQLSLLFMLPQKLNGKLILVSVKGSFDAAKLQALKDPQNLLSSDELKVLGILAPNQALQIGPMQFKFVGAFAKTGIQFKSSAGDWMMIVGMVILICGVLISFGSKRTLWAIQAPSQGNIVLLGNSDRAKDLFCKEFENLVLSFDQQS